MYFSTKQKTLVETRVTHMGSHGNKTTMQK